jgi:hypothetical protein
MGRGTHGAWGLCRTSQGGYQLHPSWGQGRGDPLRAGLVTGGTAEYILGGPSCYPRKIY